MEGFVRVEGNVGEMFCLAGVRSRAEDEQVIANWGIHVCTQGERFEYLAQFGQGRRRIVATGVEEGEVLMAYLETVDDLLPGFEFAVLSETVPDEGLECVDDLLAIATTSRGLSRGGKPGAFFK